MARRAPRHELIDLVPQLAGLAMLFLLFVPGGLYLTPTVAGLLLLFTTFTVLAVTGFCLYRRSFQPAQKSTPVTKLAERQDAPVNAPKPKPATTRELLERLRAIDWYQFEKIVALAYRKSGFRVEQRGGANPDGGIDILLTAQAGNQTAIQCKHWKTWNVGVKVIREFVGALKDAGIQRGIFITLAGYTGEAKLLAERNGIELLNDTRFARLLESMGARFDPEALELLNDTRKFCPKCQSELKLKTALKGSRPGSQFWGCSAFPRCRFAMPF